MHSSKVLLQNLTMTLAIQQPSPVRQYLGILLLITKASLKYQSQEKKLHYLFKNSFDLVIEIYNFLFRLCHSGGAH